MSWTQRPPQIELVARDGSQNESKSRHWLPPALAVTDIESYLDVLGQRVEALSDAEITGVWLSYLYAQLALAAALPGSDVHQVGTFILQAAGGDRLTFLVPSIKASKLQTSGTWTGVAIDQADPDVQALINLITVGDGTVQPVTYSQDDITTLTAAYKQYRG